MIIINNESLLRVKCEPVKLEEVGELIDELEKELNYSNKLGRSGIGLAAPQIGIAKDIAIIRFNKINLNLINARLENGYDPAIFREEGCLSFPNRVEDTMRFQEVHINSNLESPNNFIATGLLAVVIQHELDHLNSILFMDHMIPKQTFILKNKMGPNDICSCGSGKKFKKCQCHYH